MKHRIYLRALELDDYKTSYLWRNDEEIQNMVGGSKYFVSMENERQWVLNNTKNEHRIVLAICLVENNKFIGTVNIQDIDWINRTASIPILIGDKNEWGKGYATEARMMALNFAFNERNLHKITDYVLDDNHKSLKLHNKCGYKEEGLIRDSVFKNGKYHNQVVLGVIKEEFEEVYTEYVNKFQR